MYYYYCINCIVKKNKCWGDNHRNFLHSNGLKEIVFSSIS